MSTSTRARPVERFKPTSGFALGYVGLVVVAVTVVYCAWSVHTLTGLRLGLAGLFAGVLVWATQIRPRATAYPRHVVLKNSLRDAHVPYVVVDEVSIGQTLSLWVGKDRFVCIGIGNSLRTDLKNLRRERLDPADRGSSRLSELELKALRSDSDERAMSYQTFVTTRLEGLIDEAKREQARERARDRAADDTDEPAEPDRPERQVAWPEVAALVVTGLAFVLSLLL